MTRYAPVADRQLERQGRRMFRPAVRLFAVSLIPMAPGIVLLVIGSDGLLGLGIALILISTGPLAVALGLLFSGSITRWAARHRLFA